MLETIRALLEQSPLLALFLAIGLGYAFGAISISGFSLGIGAVLFAGLGLGALAPNSAPPALVSSIGLVLFLYGVGIQYGRQFFAGLKGAGLKWNLIGALGVLVALVLAMVVGRLGHLSPAHTIGLFAGSMTSTPALQAAIDAAGNPDPAIGYSVAYPFGVIGPILGIFAFTRLVKTRVAPPAPALAPIEILLDEPRGRSVADVIAGLPPGVELASVRHGGVNRLPEPELKLAAGDAVLLVGLPDALEQARQALGRTEPGRIANDRGDLDIARFYVSRRSLIGTTVGRCPFPDGVAGKIVEVRRGDAALFPASELVLEHGDRVTVIASREARPALRKHFGDSMKSTTEFSYISVGIGMSLGVLAGLIPIPLPGAGSFTLGLAGGPLLMALVLGRIGRLGPMSWHIPLAANLSLRTFGLTLFLAAVGLGSGTPFVKTLSGNGASLLAMGVAVVLAAVLAVVFLGHTVFKLSTDELLGVISGTCGNPAILAYATSAVPSDRVDVAFATIYPTTTILKIICAQVAIGLLSP